MKKMGKERNVIKECFIIAGKKEILIDCCMNYSLISSPGLKKLSHRKFTDTFFKTNRKEKILSHVL